MKTNTFLTIFFTDHRDLALEQVMAYPPYLRRDVINTFIKIAGNESYWFNLELTLSKRCIVTNVVLDEDTPYEGTVRKLLLLSYVDGIINGYFKATTRTNIIF